jgi:hypothetical protein
VIISAGGLVDIVVAVGVGIEKNISIFGTEEHIGETSYLVFEGSVRDDIQNFRIYL